MNKLLLLLSSLLLIGGGYTYYQDKTSLDLSSKSSSFAEVGSTSIDKQPSPRSKKAAIEFYLLLDTEHKQSYLDMFSEDGNFVEATNNLAIIFDSDTSKLIQAENAISEQEDINSYPTTETSVVQDTSNRSTLTTGTNDVCNCKGYDGPGGICYSGPGGAAYNGPGGAAYDGPGGPCYDGPGGSEYSGPGGTAYDGPGGPRYSGPGGAAYDGPGGACYDGPGGACYSGPGGGANCPSICR